MDMFENDHCVYHASKKCNMRIIKKRRENYPKKEEKNDKN